MRRRAALAALTTLVPAAGCIDAGAGPRTDTGSPFRDDCPSFADDADRTVCYRRDRGDAALLLAPEDGPLVVDAGGGDTDTADDRETDTAGDGDTDTADDRETDDRDTDTAGDRETNAGETDTTDDRDTDTTDYRETGDRETDTAGDSVVDAVSLVLRNGTAQPFEFNPYGWTLRRRTDDGWEHVAPDVVVEPLLRLPPGGTHRWSLSAVPHPSPRDPDATTIDVDVSPGVHAFAVDGTLGDGPRVECVARFAVVRRAEG